jgi:hypothetical protein
MQGQHDVQRTSRDSADGAIRLNRRSLHRTLGGYGPVGVEEITWRYGLVGAFGNIPDLAAGRRRVSRLLQEMKRRGEAVVRDGGWRGVLWCSAP